MRRKYGGGMDWALGFRVGHLETGEVGVSKDISTRAGYRTVLAVIEARRWGTYRMAEAQVLGYVGCLYREREARGTREDSSVFGIATNGDNWQFFMLDQKGASSVANNQRAYVPVRMSQPYDISNEGDLRTVLVMIIYILQRDAALLTPHRLPVAGDDEAGIVGSI